MSNERLRGLSIHRPIIYGNVAVLLTPEERKTKNDDHTHRWTVAVRGAASAPDSDTVGGADDISYFVKRVQFKLHDTYTLPNRILDKPPFEVSETGWGEFEIQIRITFIPEAGEKALIFHHHLKLHPWSTTSGASTNPNLATESEGGPPPPPPPPPAPVGPVHSWQYDEIVFHEPLPAFYNILVAHPPTLLPATVSKNRPAPPHPSHPDSLIPSGVDAPAPEFTAQMAKAEGDRLDFARDELLRQIESYRGTLTEREKELEQLKQQLREKSDS